MKNYEIYLPEAREVIVRIKMGRLPVLKELTDKLFVLDVIDTDRDVRAKVQVNDKIITPILFTGSEYKKLSQLTIEEINNKLIDIL